MKIKICLLTLIFEQFLSRSVKMIHYKHFTGQVTMVNRLLLLHVVSGGVAQILLL